MTNSKKSKLIICTLAALLLIHSIQSFAGMQAYDETTGATTPVEPVGGDEMEEMADYTEEVLELSCSSEEEDFEYEDGIHYIKSRINCFEWFAKDMLVSWINDESSKYYFYQKNQPGMIKGLPTEFEKTFEGECADTNTIEGYTVSENGTISIATGEHTYARNNLYSIYADFSDQELYFPIDKNSISLTFPDLNKTSYDGLYANLFLYNSQASYKVHVATAFTELERFCNDGTFWKRLGLSAAENIDVWATIEGPHINIKMPLYFDKANSTKELSDPEVEIWFDNIDLKLTLGALIPLFNIEKIYEKLSPLVNFLLPHGKKIPNDFEDMVGLIATDFANQHLADQKDFFYQTAQTIFSTTFFLPSPIDTDESSEVASLDDLTSSEGVLQSLIGIRPKENTEQDANNTAADKLVTEISASITQDPLGPVCAAKLIRPKPGIAKLGKTGSHVELAVHHNWIAEELYKIASEGDFCTAIDLSSLGLAKKTYLYPEDEISVEPSEDGLALVINYAMYDKGAGSLLKPSSNSLNSRTNASSLTSTGSYPSESSLLARAKMRLAYKAIINEKTTRISFDVDEMQFTHIGDINTSRFNKNVNETVLRNSLNNAINTGLKFSRSRSIPVPVGYDDALTLGPVCVKLNGINYGDTSVTLGINFYLNGSDDCPIQLEDDDAEMPENLDESTLRNFMTEVIETITLSNGIKINETHSAVESAKNQLGQSQRDETIQSPNIETELKKGLSKERIDESDLPR